MQTSSRNPDKSGVIPLRCGAKFCESFVKRGLSRFLLGENEMFGLSKNRSYAIGIDLGDDTLKIAQLGCNGKGIDLIASGIQNRPVDVIPGSSNWQRWAIEAICQMTANGKFQGRTVVAAIPASEVFIDHIKMPKIENKTTNVNKNTQNENPLAKYLKWKPDSYNKLQQAVFSKIKGKLPFEPDDAMIKYIPTEQDNVLVIATERRKIDRHLAIYEKADLQIKSIAVWPTALTNSYIQFFGRRKTDIEAVVMLLDIETNSTNVVICRHKNLLFARSISIGTKQLDNNEMAARLVLELTACRQLFASMHKKAQIERLIFLSSQTVNKDICTQIAKQLETPAQIGDCLAAVEAEDPYCSGIDRRGCQVNWATAFGLSLS